MNPESAQMSNLPKLLCSSAGQLGMDVYALGSEDWVSDLARTLNSFVILEKLLNLFKFQFPYL